MDEGLIIELDKQEAKDFKNILRKIRNLTYFSDSEKQLLLLLKSLTGGWSD